MFLEVYNQLLSNMLNQRWALTKLRAELERREGRLYRQCRKFGHLTWNCRREREQKKKEEKGNKFEVLRSRVIQCEVREVRRQEVVGQIVKYF